MINIRVRLIAQLMRMKGDDVVAYLVERRAPIPQVSSKLITSKVGWFDMNARYVEDFTQAERFMEITFETVYRTTGLTHVFGHTRTHYVDTWYFEEFCFTELAIEKYLKQPRKYRVKTIRVRPGSEISDVIQYLREKS